MANYFGTSGDDKLTGDWHDDVFDINQGGNDTVLAGGGDDLIVDSGRGMAAEPDRIVGGAGFDTFMMEVYYDDTTVVLDGENVSGVEELLVDTSSAASDATFNITLTDSVATPDLKGGVFEVLNAVYDAATLIVDASAETDTPLLFKGGWSTETYYGGAMGDTFDFANSGASSSGYGGGGDDVFTFTQGHFTTNCAADGGDGFDVLNIQGGDFATLDIALRPQNVVGIEQINLEGAKRIIFADANVANNAAMTVNGAAATLGMTLDASREVKASYHLIGGSGDDKLIGGGGKDVLEGGAGKNVLTGGGKTDLFVISLLGDENSTTITDLSAQDRVDLHAIDADITHDGDQRFKLVAAFTGKAGQAMLSYDAAHDVTSLSFDVDGDGHSDGSVRLSGDQTGFTHFVL